MPILLLIPAVGSEGRKTRGRNIRGSAGHIEATTRSVGVDAIVFAVYCRVPRYPPRFPNHTGAVIWFTIKVVIGGIRRFETTDIPKDYGNRSLTPVDETELQVT